jgi:hypothetical protein
VTRVPALRKLAVLTVATLVLSGLTYLSLGPASATAPSMSQLRSPTRRLANPGTGLPVGMLPTHAQAARAKQARALSAGRAAITPTPHLNYYGGPVVSNAQVFSVLWGTSGSYLPEVSGSTSPNMDTFFGHVPNSGYFSWLGEYNTPTGTDQTIGLGAFAGLTAITPSLLASGATIQDSTIQSELRSQIAAGHVPAPALDPAGRPNTVYALFFPAGTRVCNGTDCSGAQFCAYHSAFATSIAGLTRKIRYLVLPDPDSTIVSGCSSTTANTPLRVLQSYTSHELVETVTDPDGSLATTFGPPLGWYDPNNDEIGDICVGTDGTDGTITGTDGVVYVVQKEWSNALNACIVTKPAGADRTAPLLQASKPARLFQLSTRITTAYHATDTGSGVANYDIQYRVSKWNGRFGPYITLATRTTSTSRSITGRRGHEYCFRERARDRIGNLTAWSHDRCTSVALDDRALVTASAGWHRVSSSTAYHRTLTQTTMRGAKLRLAGLRADRIALVVTTCPSCGNVAIYLNGVLLQSLSTTAPTRNDRIILIPRRFSLRATTLVLKATSKWKRVLIDGLAVSRQ